MARIIEVTVSPTGEATVQTKGYAGSECQQASKFIEQDLGVVTQEAKTMEFFVPTEQQQEIKA